MKRNLVKLFVLVLLGASSQSYAQHILQIDDGLGHYTLIKSSNSTGIFTLPATIGQILTFTPGISPAWLCGGNTNPNGNTLGPLTAQDLLIKTNGALRATFTNVPSSTVPILALQNTTPGIQGMHINGSLDAVPGNTLGANPGVWDLVVDGDAVVSGIYKSGNGSMWFDGNSATHSIIANKPLEIRTTSNDSLIFSIFNSTKMMVATNGYVGIGTMNPVSPLHIVGNPPNPTFANLGKLLVPDPFNHVLTVENLSNNAKGNGIAIIIHNPAGTQTVNQANSVGVYNNNQSNYVTFYNDAGDHTHVKGRIEGFSNKNFNDAAVAFWNAVSGFISSGDIYNPFNYFTFNVAYDNNWISFNPNFVNFTAPSFPTLSGGSLPSLHWSSVDLGICPVCVSLSYPDGINWGSFPTISGGSIGGLSFSAPFTINGSPLTNITNPFSINYSFINSLATPLRDLPYKDKFILALKLPMGPIAFAASYGAAFLGGITFESGSGDYAEWLERADHNENIMVGDVVGVVGGKISKNTEGASQLMVASFKPCVLGNMPDEGKEQFFHKIAFMGQVPVKMNSSVKKGDYIVPDGKNNGFAKAITPENITADQLDKVFGVAWEDAPQDGVKFVKIAVGLKPHEMVSVIKNQSMRLNNLNSKAAEVDQLSADVLALKNEMNPAHKAKFSKKKTKHSKLLTSK